MFLSNLTIKTIANRSTLYNFLRQIDLGVKPAYKTKYWYSMIVWNSISSRFLKILIRKEVHYSHSGSFFFLNINFICIHKSISLKNLRVNACNCLISVFSLQVLELLAMSFVDIRMWKYLLPYYPLKDKLTASLSKKCNFIFFWISNNHFAPNSLSSPNPSEEFLGLYLN